MDALIRHLEEKQELAPVQVEAAAEQLLDPGLSDEKKMRLLEAFGL
jgi:hypothetical protein